MGRILGRTEIPIAEVPLPGDDGQSGGGVVREIYGIATLGEAEVCVAVGRLCIREGTEE